MMEIDMESTVALEDELDSLRRQLAEANDDIDTYKGDLNEAAHAAGIELLQTNLRGKLAGLVLAMNGQVAALQAEVERLKVDSERIAGGWSNDEEKWAKAVREQLDAKADLEAEVERLKRRLWSAVSMLERRGVSIEKINSVLDSTQDSAEEKDDV